MPAMAIVPDADNKEEEQQEEQQALPALLSDAQRLYDLGCAAIGADSYEEAIDCFSKALEIRVNHYGELAPECATTYYKYGCALLYKVQAESEALCDRNEEPPPSKKQAQEEGNSEVACGSKEPADDDSDGSADEDADGKLEPEGDDSEGDAEEEEGDIELAWKLLETARVIHSKQPARSLDEVDVITSLADISLEKENFKTCYADYEQALRILEDLVEPDSRLLASTWYKMALAKQFDNRPQEALASCEKAVSICQMRLDRMYKEQEMLKDIQTDSNEKLDEGEKMDCSEAGKLDEGEKKASSEAAMENADDAGEKEASKTAKVDAEIKEIEESLVDLREKVEELKQMASAPSLFDALKAENPEAATMMSEAVGAVFKRISRVEGTSLMGETAASFPGSSSAEASIEPVTHLGIVGRGIKRATPVAITDEPLLPPDVQPAKRSAESLLSGSGDGETQNGFGGAS